MSWGILWIQINPIIMPYLGKQTGYVFSVQMGISCSEICIWHKLYIILKCWSCSLYVLPLCRHLCLKTCDCSFLRNYRQCVGLWVGRAPARINLMFWGECIVVSHRNSVDIYCTSQSQILPYILEYMTQIRMFTVYCHQNK